MLELKNVSKDFTNFQLDKISFSLEAGYIMGFIGPNGSGKTSTIRLIMNLLRKDSGEIKVFGKDHIREEKEIKNRIGFVYDESYFYEDLTIRRMKDIIAPFYKGWNEKTFENYTRDFNLNPNQKIKKLSKGMKMKFSLALALSHEAELIIMDEPTSGLDPVFRREILDVLQRELEDERKSIFFSSHITTDLEKIADFVTFINDGKIVFSKNKDELLESYKIIKGGSDLLGPDNRKEFIGLREGSLGFEGLVDNVEKIKYLLGSEILIEKPSLEDIMVYTVRR